MTAHSLYVQIADITIRFESEQECDIDELGDFLKYHRIEPVLQANCVVVLKRQASFRLPKDAKALWKSQRRTIGEQDLVKLASCYISHERGEYYYCLMRDNAWICYNPSEKRIRFVIHQPPKRKDSSCDRLTSPMTAILLLLHVITTAHSRFIVHGAAVCKEGKASLFLGESGSGKSTLSISLAQQNFAFMGDDLVLVYMKDNIPMVGALVLPAKLYIDNHEEKTNVDVPETVLADYCLSAPLEAVYSIQQTSDFESSVEPLPASELLQQLIEASNGMLMQYDKQQWLHTMYAVSEQIPYFLFHFGNRTALNFSSSTPFVIQIAELTIDIVGYRGQSSACLEGLMRIFRYHETHAVASHHIVVCPSNQFHMPDKAVLQWKAPCLGVAGKTTRARTIFSRLFTACSKKPVYSGTCNVMCYNDAISGEEYYIPEHGEWRVVNKPQEHTTYVYSDEPNDVSDGLPSMLVNIIGSEYGYYMAFAACVAVEGEAQLMIGESGVGKSSRCLDLIRNGAVYMGDDLVLIYLKEGIPMVGSLLFPLKCYTDIKQDHKKRLDVMAEYDIKPLFYAPLKAVYLLENANNAMHESVRSMPSEELCKNLFKLTNRANTYANAEHFVDTIYAVSTAVNGYYG